MIRGLFSIAVLVSITFPLLGQEPGSGYALSFDGNSSRVVFDDIFSDLELPVTMSAWVFRPTTTTDPYQAIFASSWPNNNTYSGVWVNMNSTGIGANFGDGRGAPNSAFRRSISVPLTNNPSGKWNHVSCVIKGPNNIEVYLNGQRLNGTYDGTGLSTMVNVAGAKAFIGYIGNNLGPHYYEGNLDEIRVWNYARSLNEIRSDMCKRLNGDETGLVGYWKMDQGSGTELIDDGNGNQGVFEGGISWVTSGAPIGDESFLVYFTAGSKEKMKFKNELDSFWISSTNGKWEGYQIYKVNQSPNTSNGSTLSLDDGYYGVFPIFSQGAQGEFRLDLGTPYCSIGDFRFGNDDINWEPIVSQSDTSLFITSNTTTEFVFLDGTDFDEVSQNYNICLGESLIIDAFDNCVLSYSWNNASVESELDVSEAGVYWVDRTTLAGTFRSYFNVQLIEIDANIITEETIQLCPSDLPFHFELENVNVISWSNGQTGNSIEIDESGTYTVNFQTVCGVMSDEISIIVEDLDVFVPNVFTPNGDNINDCFKVGEGLLGSSLLVVNRAGVIVFEDVNYQNNWCMLSIESGIYFYHLQNNCLGKELKGWVQVLK